MIYQPDDGKPRVVIEIRDPLLADVFSKLHSEIENINIKGYKFRPLAGAGSRDNFSLEYEIIPEID